MYKVGDVVKTTVLYTSTGKEAKKRWFVYLGKVDFTQNPRNIFLCTTTTEMEKYKENKDCVYVEFSPETSIFEEECLLCLDYLETSYTEDKFNEIYKPELKGRLTEEKLKEIARKIDKADLPKKIKNDILQSFRVDSVSTR